MGTFDEKGQYSPRPITENDLGSLTLEEAYAATLVDVVNGQLVEGTVVRIDKDEVLVDIGYKSEGVVPQKVLSIRDNADPGEVVAMGEQVEALVLQREDSEGRLVLSKKRAQYERAWGRIEDIKEAEGMVTGTVIEVVKGGLIVDIGLRGFLPASLVACAGRVTWRYTRYIRSPLLIWQMRVRAPRQRTLGVGFLVEELSRGDRSTQAGLAREVEQLHIGGVVASSLGLTRVTTLRKYPKK